MRTEKTLWGIFVIGRIMHLLGINGGGLLNTISLLALAIIYFPLGFYFFSDKSIKEQNHVLTWIAAFFLSVIPLGILYKTQHWNGAQPSTLMIGALGGIVIALISFRKLRTSLENLETYYNNMFIRSFVLSCTAIIVTFLPL